MTKDAEFESMIERLGPRLMELLARLTSDHATAQDIYQDTWFAVFRQRHRLRAEGDGFGYVKTIAVRRFLKSTRRSGQVLTGGDPEPEAPRRPSVDLERLSKVERLCLVLYFFGGFAVKEIAALLEIPEGTVKTRMRTARERLREEFLEAEKP